MADRVAVSNLALQKLGADDRLTDPADESIAARSIDAVWDMIRTAVLRDHPWNFGLKRRSMPSRVLASDETIYPWGYAFPLPEDCLRFHEVLGPEGSEADYLLEGSDVLSDSEGPLIIRYVADVTEPHRWDAAFVEAFAARLAFQISDRLTGDPQRQQAMWNEYQMMLKRAKMADGRENPPIDGSYEQSSWVTARYGD